ncbi:uncharacterized protein B0P05DRAFT_552974 [Gilbertella persicaria]|uniref:uncharacterized protein n=1 Tax=Gilbertella persicaria TaxID=101096 RepID=UPI00222122E0|nr:uncharacterized protein B0P05DRAFT_552974 [Gilbertella persicaria]KAI8066963.1 hypothetical protein B0P05DRAFT_552974 [Gilbertella persicaria]
MLLCSLLSFGFFSLSSPPAWFAAFQAKFERMRSNSALKKELAAARSRILELESKLAHLLPLLGVHGDDLVAAPSSSVSPSAAGSKWAQAFGKSKNGLFMSSLLANKYRDRLSAFRRKLRLIGLDNSRVLDVHYPARNVEDLLKVMAKYSLPVLTDFDPFSAANVKDPAFASLDADALSAKARELQQARLVRALGFIREQVRRQVAYDFVRQGWLSKEQAGSVVGPLSAVAGAGAGADAPSVSPSSMDFTLAGDGEPVSSS